MANPNGRQSLVQIELTGKLPNEQPDYIQTVEWDILTAHVNDGMTIGAIAEVHETTWPKMQQTINRLGALVARNLGLPDSALAAMRIDEPRARTQRPKVGRQAAPSQPEGRQPRIVTAVTITLKSEDLEGCNLVAEDAAGKEIRFDDLPRAAARDFEVGKTYNLYLG